MALTLRTDEELAAAVTPWHRIIVSHPPEHYMLAWSGSLIVIVVLLASVDDGPTSPLTALLTLPLVLAAMAYPIRSVIGIGALTVVARLAIAFSAPPVRLGETAIHVAILLLIAVMGALISRNHQRALARAEDLAARLERLASVDSLTGCFNHRGFHERLDAEAACAIREALPLALLHFDLDHFKAVNDTFGHPVGDDVLITVGAPLRGVARRSDTVGRLGGEEFAVLLPHTTAADAEQRRTRSCAASPRACWRASASSPSCSRTRGS